MRDEIMKYRRLIAQQATWAEALAENRRAKSEDTPSRSSKCR